MNEHDYERSYEPVQPRGGFNFRSAIDKIVGAAIVVGSLAVKGFLVFAKLGTMFVSIAAYALLWGWQFGVGFVALIFVHEMGHFVSARRFGIHSSWPTFIPFFGAYVLIQRAGLTPWRNAVISLAGPFAGGIGAAACWIAGSAADSQVLRALAFAGFALNLLNLIPIGFFDGGAVARAAAEQWRMPVIRFEGGVPMQALAPDRTRAFVIVTLYVSLVVALLYGLIESHVPQQRL